MIEPVLPVGGDALVRELVGLAQQSPALMAALRAARALDLPSWAIGAGVVRNEVWDHLHGYKQATPMQDVDVVYSTRITLAVRPSSRCSGV